MFLSENILNENIIWHFLFISLDFQKNFLVLSSKSKMYNFIIINFCCSTLHPFYMEIIPFQLWFLKWVKSIMHLIAFQPYCYTWVIGMNPPFFKWKTQTTEKCKCFSPNSQRKRISRARIVCVFKSYVLICNKPCLIERHFPSFLHSSKDWMGQCMVPGV